MTIVDQMWQSRLRAVLGASLSELRYEHVQQLVMNRAAEAADLDFKGALYGAADGDRQELCKDVAGMRNHRGGMIILGISNEDGVAIDAPGVPLSDAETARMLQIVAAGTAPYAEFEIEAIPGAAQDLGFYVLVAPPSPMRPHAVLNRDWLRYPRRNGTVTRWLSEVEVADLYRDRFRGQADQLDRLQRIGDEAIAQMNSDGPWLVAAAVPNQAGELPMSFVERRTAEEWLRGRHTSYDYVDGFFEPPAVPLVGVGVERYTMKSHFDQEGLANYSYAECHADGACAAARQLNSPQGDGTVLTSQLVLAAAKCLRLIGAHAARSGASGDAAVHLRVVGPSMRLGYIRDGSVQHYEPGATLREGHSRHTLPLQPLADVGQDLFLAVRLVLMDMFNAFGRAEVQHITDDGTLRLRYFGDPDFARWTQDRGLAITSDAVDE